MAQTFLIVAAVAGVGAVISGLLGFVLYPAQTAAKRRAGGSNKKTPPPPRQGLARALFVIFAATTFLGLFFGLLLPPG